MNCIYADVNKYDDEYRLILVCLGTHRDLEKYNIKLEQGLELVFYHDDADGEGRPDNLVFKGRVEYDDKNERWVARIDWDAIKNVSKLSPDGKKKLGIA